MDHQGVHKLRFGTMPHGDHGWILALPENLPPILADLRKHITTREEHATTVRTRKTTAGGGWQEFKQESEGRGEKQTQSGEWRMVRGVTRILQ